MAQACPLSAASAAPPVADDVPAALCHRLLNLEQRPVGGRRAAQLHLRRTLSSAAAAASAWVERHAALEPARFVDALASTAERFAADPGDTALASPAADHVLTRFAPQRLLAGCALQGLARADNNHEPIACLAHGVHAHFLGDGRHEHHAARRYRRSLERRGISLPSVRSARLWTAVEWQPSDWQLPALRLSLGSEPRGHEAQAFGAALFEACVGLPGLVRAALQLVDPHAAAIESAADAVVRQAAIDAVTRLLADDAGLAPGIVAGFQSSEQAHAEWQASVMGELDGRHLSPASAMLGLIARKARHAVGYHGRLKMAGGSFDDLLVRDPASFVAGLATSRWIKPGQPDQSLLLTRLVRFGGPMFRVFSDDELEVIRQWVLWLPGAAADTTSAVAARPTPSLMAVPAANDEVVAASARPRRLHVRDRYQRLLTMENHPEVAAEAREFAQDWLDRHASAARGADAAPFETYSHERLRAWFDERSAQQAKSYDAESTTVVEKTREEVIDEALQLAPMILVDGAWLQRWSCAGLCDTPIGALLFKIFSDEIGNGRSEWNHPNIYRQLLAQMALDLPDFRSREFAWDRRLDDASFEVPVFWLSVSQYPMAFLPETLGLNLAMELSGVGGSYRTARDELRHYGFPTLFVDLHNTIDNVSSGHSAMALEAIQLHMDEALCAGSPALVAEQWRRIWTGFLALSPPARRWRDAWSRVRLA